MWTLLLKMQFYTQFNEKNHATKKTLQLQPPNLLFGIENENTFLVQFKYKTTLQIKKICDCKKTYAVKLTLYNNKKVIPKTIPDTCFNIISKQYKQVM